MAPPRNPLDHEAHSFTRCRTDAGRRRISGARPKPPAIPLTPAPSLPGDLFFAVRGERLDGHDYVEAALQKGAVAAVVEKQQRARFAAALPLLAVENTLAALQQLGAAVRRLWGKPLIGVTGSAGKTTTKEAIAHVLATRYRVLKSHGNLNNHFGLPLQLLRLEPEHELAVIEMGMSHAGEITALAGWRGPTAAWSPRLRRCTWSSSTPSPASRAPSTS